MSMSIVRPALESRLATWAAAQSPVLAIAYQNVSFTKPTTPVIWLETFILPNETFNRDVSAKGITLRGMFQVNVWAPAGRGSGAGEAVAEAIAALYPVFPKFGAVSVDSPATVGRSLPDPSGWIITPVLIKYRYERNG